MWSTNEMILKCIRCFKKIGNLVELGLENQGF